MARSRTTSGGATPIHESALMTVNPGPPPWAEFALKVFLMRRDFEPVSGDLLEEYRQNVCGMRGSLRANLWYATQVLGFAWRRAGLWGALFAIAFLARTAMDWHMLTTDFQTRSAVSTLLAAGIFLAAGFWAGWRSGSSVVGGCDRLICRRAGTADSVGGCRAITRPVARSLNRCGHSGQRRT